MRKGCNTLEDTGGPLRHRQMNVQLGVHSRGGSGENWAQHAQAAGILMAHEDLRLTLLKGSTKTEMLSRAQLAQKP